GFELAGGGRLIAAVHRQHAGEIMAERRRVGRRADGHHVVGAERQQVGFLRGGGLMAEHAAAADETRQRCHEHDAMRWVRHGAATGTLPQGPGSVYRAGGLGPVRYRARWREAAATGIVGTDADWTGEGRRSRPAAARVAARRASGRRGTTGGRLAPARARARVCRRALAAALAARFG